MTDKSGEGKLAEVGMFLLVNIEEFEKGLFQIGDDFYDKVDSHREKKYQSDQAVLSFKIEKGGDGENEGDNGSIEEKTAIYYLQLCLSHEFLFLDKTTVLIGDEEQDSNQSDSANLSHGRKV